MARAKYDAAHDEMRRRILEAALPHVPFDGWTLAVLSQGAEDAGYDPALALNAFPGGVIEAIEFHAALADRAMVEAMEEAGPELRTRERVALAIRSRLEANARHKEAIRRALTILALPTNAPIALRSLWRTVDAIWYGAGDKAVDFNFYTKRGLLAGVYTATLLHWLNDRSEGSEATWRFLERRIDDVMRAPRLLGEIGKIFQRFPFAPPGTRPRR
jgi:ubiquinone biosynthesis protein COQ9